MPEKSLTTEQVLELLSTGPQRITAATADIAPAKLRAAPAPGEWSANEILAHMRSCADMWGGAIARMLAEEHPTIRAINPRTWIHQTDYLELDFRSSLDAYLRQRSDLLDLLKSLPSESWSRSATVTGAGKPLERTMFFYAQWLATHERPHVKQIERAAQVVQNM